MSKYTNGDGRFMSVEDAAKRIESGDVIWMSPVCSAPIALMEAINKRREELRDVHVWSALLVYPFAFLRPEFKGHIDYHTIFLGPLERKFASFGTVHPLSASFSHALGFCRDYIRPNVLLVEVSEPDKNGRMSLGPAGGAVSELVKLTATKVLAQINPNVPFIYGEGNTIGVEECTAICEHESPLFALPPSLPNETQLAIARQISPLIADGSTIQLGIGEVSTAIGYELMEKKDLGIHTEMLTDSMVELMKRGVVTNEQKTSHVGRSVFGFALGSPSLYDFIRDNPDFYAMPIHKVCNPYEIAKNDNFVSINTALMVDLTGQVASESIGPKQISGTGGQLDFVRGASMSKGGKSIIAFESTAMTKEGLTSRIVAALPLGTAVTTPRTDVQYVVTEYGVAELYNRSFEDRVKVLIQIAHPDFRDELAKQVKGAGLAI